MTFSQCRFLLDIARKHTLTAFPLSVSLAKLPSAFSRSSRLGSSCIASSQRRWGLEGTALGLQTCCWAHLLLARVMGGGTLKSLYSFSPAGVNGTWWLPPAFRHLYKSASQQALGAGSCKALHDRIGACCSAVVQQNVVQILEVQVRPKAGCSWVSVLVYAAI